MSPINWFLAILFIIHLLLTIGVQFSNGPARRLRRIAAFLLLPSWTFFAPNPNVGDYYLVIQDSNELGDTREWQNVDIVKPRAPISCFWNPEKRRNKAFFDIVQMYRPHMSNGELPLLSLPYLWSLHVAMGRPACGPVARRRFAIMVIQYRESSESLAAYFVSDEHPIRSSE